MGLHQRWKKGMPFHFNLSITMVIAKMATAPPCPLPRKGSSTIAKMATAPRPRAPHAFVLPFPAQGHVAPMLQLAHRLASLGFFVTFVTPDRIHSRLLAQSDSGTENSYQDIQLLPVSDGIPADKVDVQPFEMAKPVEVMETGVELLIRKLMKEEPRVTCFITENIIPWVPDVADRVGVPRVDFWPSSAIAYSVLYHAPLLTSKGYLPYRGEPDTEDISTCIPGFVPVLRAADLPEFQHFTHVRAAIKSTETILVHSFYELESYVIDGLRQELPIYTIGPLLQVDPGKRRPNPFHEDGACLEWLNTREPSSVLYISFGTTGSWSDVELKELALGLEASEQPFIWVTRPTLVAEDCTLSIADIFSAQTKHRSMIISWAPQLSVLQHPSVGGFFTHCGWNSVIESMYMGVPMIGWPKVADQMANMRLISEEWKIGISLERPNNGTLVRRGAVEKAVRALFNAEEGKEARRRVAEFSKKARTAAEDGGSSKKNLQDFVKDMTKRANEATD